MKDFQVVYDTTGRAVVNWNGTVESIQNVKQKLINNMLTDKGSDEIVPSRGTSLLRTVVGGGAYNARAAQHALNFAALEARVTVRRFETTDVALEDKVKDFTAVYRGITDRVLVSDLAVTTRSGNNLGFAQPIP